MNIFKALFGGRSGKTEEKKEKSNEGHDFDVLKYDGVRALKQHQPEYAVQCFIHALKLNDTDFECRDYLSQAYIAMGDLPNAYEQLRQMSDACPDNVAVLLRMSEVAYMMESYIVMADAAEKALLIDGDNVQTYYMYAKACRGQGDLVNAAAMLTRAIMLRDDFDAARLLRGEVLLENGELDEAAADAAELCLRVGESEDVLLLKARVLEAQGKHGESEKVYGRVIEVNPFCIEAFTERSIVRRTLGNNAGAAEDDAVAKEMMANVPKSCEGIEYKLKEKMRQIDAYQVFGND